MPHDEAEALMRAKINMREVSGVCWTTRGDGYPGGMDSISAHAVWQVLRRWLLCMMVDQVDGDGHIQKPDVSNPHITNSQRNLDITDHYITNSSKSPIASEFRSTHLSKLICL